VRNLCHLRSGIQCGFRTSLFLSIVLAFTSHVAGSTGTLTVNPSNINFGSVPVGSSQTQSVTLANPGGPKVTITQATLSGTGFTLNGLSYPLTLAGGQSVTCSVTFAPQAAGNDSGSVSIAFSTQTSNGKGNNSPSYGSSTTLTVPVSGTAVTSAGQIAPNPSSVNFGNVQVGSSQSQWETLTNVGGSSVTISQITDAGAGFSVSGLNLPTTLTPSQSLTFSTIFAPQTASSATGTVTVSSDATNATLTIPQAGTGTAQGQLAVSPTSANFGNVTVGTSTSLAGTLSATGASVTVSSASVSNSEFSLSGVTFPLTIAAGQSMPITVAFAPQASGTASGTLSFTSNASNSSTESLAGDGVAPLQHSVSLSWTASTSQVVGYNVYRGGTSGGPYTRINSALDSSTNYTDSSVQAGQTYYYVTTAVDSTRTESAYSTQVQAVIPSP
jgi:Abnormal spindle-like microcephaly-assoc'd, ASPM-SPD-2-Hydin